jgi:hypothetical protein
MQTMSTNHAKFSLGYHIIWCTKYRHQVLRNAIEIELKRILAETCIQYDWKLQSLEIMPDHRGSCKTQGSSISGIILADFRFKLRGLYRENGYYPRNLNRKSAQKNPEIDRT